MARRWLARCLVLLAALAIAACGGGGGGAAPMPPVADAGVDQGVLAGETATLDGSRSHGADGATLSYAWSLADKPSGSTATLSGATSATPQLATDVAGAYVASLVVTDGTHASAAATVTVTAVAASALTIVTSAAEPLAGNVQLSLSGPVRGAGVTWYADLAPLGSGATANWNAGAATNGSHLLSAQVQVSATRVVEIRRIVDVGNPPITLGPTVVGSSGTILLKVTAHSAATITSVSASLDGHDLGTLTAVNGCGQILTCNQFVYSLYQFPIDGPGVGSGVHTAIVTATDSSGATAQAAVTVTVSNTPVLVVDSPVDGAFAFGTLQLVGSASSDKPGPVTVTADLGGTPFLQSQAAAFSGSFDLGGVPPGTYTLTVRATDSTQLVTTVQRSVVVASAQALAYAPVAALGANARLLATDGQRVVYVAGDLGVHLLDWGASTDVVLQHAADVAYAIQWQLAGGQVFASGKDPADCAAVNCVYHWLADGTRANLADANPVATGAVQVWPVAHDGHALWSNDSPSGYTLYDIASSAFTLVTPDAGVGTALPAQFDFSVQGGIVQVVHAGTTGAGLADVFAWHSDTATSTRLSTPGRYSVAPQTDGVRVAWSELPAPSAAAATSSLVVAPLGGGAPSTLSTSMSRFLLRDGVLAWIEVPGTAAVLKVSAANGTRTLSSSGDTALVGSGAGTVVYAAGGRTVAWNASSGQAATLVDVVPAGALVAGGKLVFTQGASGTLYAIAID